MTENLPQTTIQLLSFALVSLGEAAKCSSVDNTRMYIADAVAAIDEAMTCAKQSREDAKTSTI
jgi:hypothetical protein